MTPDLCTQAQPCWVNVVQPSSPSDNAVFFLIMALIGIGFAVGMAVDAWLRRK